MKNLLTAIWQSILSTNPVLTLVSAGFTFIVGLFSFVNDLWGVLMAKIATVALPEGAALATINGLSFANYVVPLQELFTFLTAYLALMLTMAVIRIVKSFIPTIA